MITIAAGRPRKEINKTEFEKLCGLQCALDEIADWFDCSEDTIERWCKRTYKENFADVFAKKRGKGKIALRRAQFELAKKSAAMAIFLGKNYLGQTDNGGTAQKDIEDLAPLAEMINSEDTDDTVETVQPEA